MDLIILIQGMKEGELYGYLVHSHMQKLSPFKNMQELMFAIDGVGREKPFPTLKDIEDAKTENLKISEAEDLDLSGERKTEGRPYGGLSRLKPREFFHLSLIGRYHGSFQGSIRGSLTGGRYVYFQSALELMHLLSEIRLVQADYT